MEPTTVPMSARRPAGQAAPRIVRSRHDAQSSVLLRLLLRVVLGMALFLFVVAVRQLGGGDDVQRELATWDEAIEDTEVGDAPEPTAEELQESMRRQRSEHLARAADEKIEPGPPALRWLESDRNQVSSGDKDGVRALAGSLKRAGAVEVYVGRVDRSGFGQVCGELVVEMPEDASKRQAVLKAYTEYRRGKAGGFGGKVRDPGRRYMRIYP
jgi:hypothetical protein